MKRVLIVYAALLIVTCIVTNTIAKEKIKIDSSSIQEYNGKLGCWKFVSSYYKFKTYLIEYSITETDVKKVNNNCNIRRSNQYLFMPYSKEYLEKLKKQGITRVSIEAEPDQFIWPIDEVNRITSVLGIRWGKFHPGLDIPACRGVPIRASMEGRVNYSAYKKAYGKLIEIEHRNGYLTRYSHNSVNLVRKGDFVKKGQIIGYVGSTGRSTGPHVHFEIRSNYIPLDPLDFLPEKKELKMVHRLKNWK